MPTRRPALLLASATVALLVGCHESNEAPAPTAKPAAVVPASPTVQPNKPAGPTRTAAAVSAPPRPLTPPVATSRPAATVIRSAAATLDAVAAGTKTSTTRKGVRSYPLGPAVLESGPRRVAVVLTAIDVKRFADLTAADAASNGSATLAAYRAQLAGDYKGIADGDQVSVVHFRPGP